jgi:thioredoxin reductase (NADPH)
VNDAIIKMNDVIIIGAGVAGLSAALWCDELGLKTLVLENEPEIGGQLLRVYNPIENHLGGLSAENGLELRDAIERQIASRKFDLKFNVCIERLDLAAKTIFLSSGETFNAKFLILATGVKRRKLNVAGEDEFRGRGILESGKRDGETARDKIAVVIGGGDAAAENALIIARTAREVYLVHRRSDFRARPEFLEKIRQNAKIKILTDTSIEKFFGTEGVEAVEIKNQKTGEINRLAVEIVLIRIGVEPNNELFKTQLKLDRAGYVPINALCETETNGVFAVGDIANPLAPTVSSAVGNGATAAKVIASRVGA